MSVRLRLKNFSLQAQNEDLFPRLNFELKSSECVSLIGSAGSGRSLFLKTLFGIAQGSVAKGDMEFFGRRHEMFFLPTRPAVFDELSVWENLFVHEFPHSRVVWSHDRLKREAEKLLYENLKYDLPVEAKGRSLSEIQRFQLGWARFFLKPRKLLLVDQSSEILSESDRCLFHEQIRDFKQSGGAILYAPPPLITSLAVSDRFLFLSRDQWHEESQAQVDHEPSLQVRICVSQESFSPPRVFPEKSNPDSQPQGFSLRDFSCGKDHRHFLQDLNFSVRKSEVFGVYGSQESGRVELFLSLFGALPGFWVKGECEVGGQHYQPESSQKAIESGLAFVSGYRSRLGLFASALASFNLSFPYLVQKSWWKWISFKGEEDLLKHYRSILRLDPDCLTQAAFHLSNDDQQKILLGRWLPLQPKVLFLDEPLRGLSEQARIEMAFLIRELSDLGLSLVIGSAQHEDLFQLCHQAVILKNGRVLGQLSKNQLNRDQLYSLAMSDQKGSVC